MIFEYGRFTICALLYPSTVQIVTSCVAKKILAKQKKLASYPHQPEFSQLSQFKNGLVVYEMPLYSEVTGKNNKKIVDFFDNLSYNDLDFEDIIKDEDYFFEDLVKIAGGREVIKALHQQYNAIHKVYEEPLYFDCHYKNFSERNGELILRDMFITREQMDSTDDIRLYSLDYSKIFGDKK